MDLAADLLPVPEPDADARRAALARRAELGRLGVLGAWLAAAQGTCSPAPPERARVIVIAGDHGPGLGDRGLSSVMRLSTDPGATNPSLTELVLVAGTSVRVVDVALDHEPGDERYHVRRGSGVVEREDALTEDETLRAFAIGRTLADEEIDSGADLLLPVSAGRDTEIAAHTLVAALTGTEPVAVLGFSGVDDAAWMRTAAAVRDALWRTKGHRGDAGALLRIVGGADLAAITGFCAQAAIRRTPVLLDGAVVAAAALLAERLAPGARQWWLLADRAPAPLVADRLDLDTVLDLGIRAGDGTAALAALPVLRTAAAALA